jgi:septal ring factor EnvC (AmiA/AmiB activator)
MERLTVGEYATKTGVSRQSVYGKIQRGTLKTVNVDNVTYIELDNTKSLQDKTTVKTVEQRVDNVKNSTKQDDKTVYLEVEIKELKQEINSLKDELKEERKEKKKLYKEIQKLNKLLSKQKDMSVNILKQFIGEMKTLTYTKENNVEIIDEQEVKDKNKKKKKK